MALDTQLHRFTSEEYDALIDSGALRDRKVELLDGLVLDMTPQGDEHQWVLHTIQRAIGFPDGFMVRNQGTLRLGDGSTPEPDIVVMDMPPSARGPYGTIHLVAEVAFSSHSRDSRKAATYARAGVRRYWIVDIPGARVVDHAAPGPDGYRDIVVRSGTDELDSGIPGQARLTVNDAFAGI